MKKTSQKIRGQYQNWFNPSLWFHIYVVVKRHQNIKNIWNLLRSAYKKQGDLSYGYNYLNKGTMYDWFHSNGVLQDNIKRYVELGIYFVKFTQFFSILASYHLLKEKICDLLNKQRIVGQPLYGVCI